MPPKMTHVEAANQYIQDVLSGAIPTCDYVRRACQRQADDLKASKAAAFPYRFDEAKAERICKFLEVLPHTKGVWAARGETIHLEAWQSFIFTTLFGWVKKSDGYRRFREGYVEVPRKNGKSVIGSGIGLYMFAADSEHGAEVYSGASTEKQAWEVFRPAKLMIERDEELRDHLGIQVNAKTLNCPADMSRFEPIIGKPGDGSSPSCALIDEFHEHATDELYATMITGMGARSQPLALIITTAGVNLGGPCYAKRTDVIKVLHGTYDAPDVFGVIYSLDNEAHDVILQSSSAIKRLEELCSCGCVQTTQIAQYVSEECACFVTTACGEKKGSATVSTIPIDLHALKDYVVPAMNSNYLIGTQNIRKNTLRNSLNGREKTQKTGKKHKINGEVIQTISARSRIADESTGMEYPLMNMIADVNSRGASVLSAESILSGYTLIIAMIQELLEGYSASTVIPESVFLAIMQKIYNAHSPTCNARSLKLHDSHLIETLPPDDWTTPEALRKANPNFGVSVSEEFLLAEQRKAIQSAHLQNNFKTKHLNIWCSSSAAYFNIQSLEPCADPSLSIEDFRGEECMAALDVGSKIDISGLVALFRRPVEGKLHYYAFAKAYCPEETALDPKNKQYQAWAHMGLLTMTSGNIIDYEQIEVDNLEWCRMFKVLEEAYDPWNAAQFGLRMQNEGVCMVEVPQNVRSHSAPMKELDALIRAGRFHFDGSPLLKWMFSNVVAKVDANDNVFPRKERNENKIDLVVAIIMALGRWIVQEDNAQDFRVRFI